MVSGGPSATPRSAPLAQIPIVWAAPTNAWPNELWVYRVYPQEFSDAVMSNVLALASFRMSDCTRAPAAFAEKDKHALFFGNLDGHYKHLAICPKLGFIDYYDPKAEADGYFQPVVEVPDQRETTRLGLRYLRMVGIDLSQIATKPGTSDPDLHWETRTTGFIDQKTKREVNLTNRFTVFFRRRIDGINVGGIALNGGMVVGFGNHSKVVELQLYWRNLKPYELRECLSPEEIAEGLNSGQIVLPPKAGPRTDITKLTINYGMPYYDSKFGDEPEAFVAPKVDLVGIAERLSGPITIQLQVPILRPSAPAR